MLTLPTRSTVVASRNDQGLAAFLWLLLGAAVLADINYSLHRDWFAIGVCAAACSGAALYLTRCCISHYRISAFSKPLPVKNLLQLANFAAEIQLITLPTTGIQTPYQATLVCAHLQKLRDTRKIDMVKAALAEVVVSPTT